MRHLRALILLSVGMCSIAEVFNDHIAKCSVDMLSRSGSQTSQIVMGGDLGVSLLDGLNIILSTHTHNTL